MLQTPREQISLADKLEAVIGSARVGPATPSSAELIATAEAIVGPLPARMSDVALRKIRAEKR